MDKQLGLYRQVAKFLLSKTSCPDSKDYTPLVPYPEFMSFSSPPPLLFLPLFPSCPNQYSDLAGVSTEPVFVVCECTDVHEHVSGILTFCCECGPNFHNIPNSGLFCSVLSSNPLWLRLDLIKLQTPSLFVQVDLLTAWGTFDLCT